MSDLIEITDFIPASPDQIYHAWLGSQAHSNFTGSLAKADTRPGGKFTAWEGYISGVNLEPTPSTRIVQSWRTTDFPDQSPASRLEITLEAVEGWTRISLHHRSLPANSAFK